MRRLFAFLMALALLALCACSGTSSKAELYFDAMDTPIQLQINGDASVLEESQKLIESIELQYSRTVSSSEVSRLNAGETIDNPETAAWFQQVLETSAKVDFRFDMTIAPVVTAWGFISNTYRIPDQETLTTALSQVGSNHVHVEGSKISLDPGTEIDLGGVAKGYASDLLAKQWKEAGITSGLAALGGNVYALGKKADGSPWRVAVRDPDATNQYLCIFSCTNEETFAVTSGTYERYFVGSDGKTYHHIIDPATGYPAESGLVSVTILGKEGWLCDLCTTAFLIAGKEKAISLFQELFDEDDSLILVTDNHHVYYSSNISMDASMARKEYVFEKIS